MKLTTSLLLPLALTAPATASFSPKAINAFLALISATFPSSLLLSTGSALLTGQAEALALLSRLDTTSNALVDGQCGDVTLLFARGTTEPGNVGSLVGPELYAALESAVGKSVTVVLQGVNDYDASVTGYLEGGSTEAASNMASLVELAFSQCPDTQVVMSGYSQGAQVTHLAAADLPAATMQKVSAVVTFGDPYSTTAVPNIDPSRVLVICHDGDDICQFGDLVLLQHLTYAGDVDTAAAFIVKQLDS